MTFNKKQALAILLSTLGTATARFSRVECKTTDGTYASELEPFDIENVAKYMADLRDNGVCTVGPGNGNCIRVSCGNTSGVWMCNDTEEEQSVDCGVIADYVNYYDGAGLDTTPNYDQPDTIIGECRCGYYDCNDVAGQVFDDQGFTVVAAYANCNLPVTNNPSQQ